MLLSSFKQSLGALDTLSFQLANGHFVPEHFHITEVGNVTRNYIDCGGDDEYLYGTFPCFGSG